MADIESHTDGRTDGHDLRVRRALILPTSKWREM